MPHPKSRHHGLLDDLDVARWHRGLARASDHTASVYLRALGRFLAGICHTPKSYLDLPAKQRDDLLDDFLARQDGAGSYLVTYVKTVGSWLRHNSANFARPIKVAGSGEHPTLDDARIPEQSHVGELLRRAGPHAAVRVALMAMSGVRPQVLGNRSAADGLRVGDLPEMTTTDGTITFTRVPTVVRVRASLSKNRKAYFTFLGSEGCATIKADLESRMVRGERLDAESAIVCPKKKTGRTFVRTNNVTSLFRLALRQSGVKGPTYILRSYFSNRCMTSGMNPEYREFMMGHKGGIAGIYTLSKQVPPDTLEKMRAEYEHACQYLETSSSARETDPLRQWSAILLQAAGTTEQEIEELDLAGMDQNQLVELLKTRMNFTPAGPQAPRQKVIPPAELEGVLSQGYVVRLQLQDGRILVELPTP